MPKAYDKICFSCSKCGQQETIKFSELPKTPEDKFHTWGSVICCGCGSLVRGFIQ